MKKVVLEAKLRTVKGKQVSTLRRQGILPAVMYGHHIDPVAISLDLKETTKILSTLTASSIVTINLEGKEHAALVREKQRNYVKNFLTHVDFQVVSLTEKIRAAVTIELVGVAPAVKDFNGVVVTGLDSIEVECLPQELPERVTVDLSKLAKLGDAVHVRDLSFGEKVEVLTDSDEMIVLVTHSKDEEVEAEAPTGIEEPEVIERGKKEEEVED